MDRALVTFYQTKYAFLDLVLRRFERYASKVGAEMVCINLDRSENVFVDKFFMVGDLPYERCLVMDVDILIRDDAPDLFSIVPEDSVGAYDEGSSFWSLTCMRKHEIETRYRAYAHLVDNCGLDRSLFEREFSYENPMNYYNLGVVVYNREAIDLHNSLPEDQANKFRAYKGWDCSEQTLFSYLVLNSGIKAFHLPACFNQMPCNRCSDYLETSYLSHYAGLKEGKEMEIVRDDRIWRSRGL